MSEHCRRRRRRLRISDTREFLRYDEKFENNNINYSMRQLLLSVCCACFYCVERVRETRSRTESNSDRMLATAATTNHCEDGTNRSHKKTLQCARARVSIKTEPNGAKLDCDKGTRNIVGYRERRRQIQSEGGSGEERGN